MTIVRIVTSVSVCFGLAVVGRGFSRATQAQPAPRNVKTIYAELCANCHGPTLAGGLAPSLLDDTWSFGGDDTSIAQSIRDGRPTTAMPPFKAVLSAQEIRALVIYIREASDRAQRDPTGVSRRGAPVPLPTTPLRSEQHAFKLEAVAEDLDTPWGIAWLPDGRLLVTERPGRLRIIENDQLQPAPIGGVPPVWVKQDGGLMDVAVHPQFATNGWIYLSFSEAGGAPGASATKIIRARLRGDQLVEHETLFQPRPAHYWVDNRHFGSRFLFDSQGRLFYSIGDRGHEQDAQDLSSPYGKLHRVYDDGRAPNDNPFVDRAGAVPTIWSYGHRNQQGLAIHPVTGELWAAEHGPRGGDELNRIEPGRNYGWPVITYGMNDDGTPITDRTEQEGMEQPVVQWTPSIAVCAIDFYTGDRFPGWKHDLFATALAHRELRRLRIDGRKVVHQEVLFKGLGRVRDVATGPDGYVYVALNMPDRVVRLIPAPTDASTGPQHQDR
ncbi:MAG: glucose sorbosone dehydrogenase [Luteitalea sp.]|nr:glucose sorbosone dehydrogenase [Luteitalea sp.]